MWCALGRGHEKPHERSVQLVQLQFADASCKRLAELIGFGVSIRTFTCRIGKGKGALLRAVPTGEACLAPPWLTYPVILLANGIAAAHRIAIAKNASPCSNA